MANFLKPTGSDAAGYDDGKPSQTLNVGASSDVALFGGGDTGDWLEVRLDTSSVVELTVQEWATPDQRKFTLKAVFPGSAKLEARDAAGRLFATLAIEVVANAPDPDTRPIRATPENHSWTAYFSEPSIHLLPSMLTVYDPRAPDIFPVPSIKFVIKLKKKSAKTTIEIRDGAKVIRAEEFTSGEMIEPGEHTWLWDGYDDDKRLNTRMLRRTPMTAYVRTDAGEDSAHVVCNDANNEPTWGDVRVYLDGHKSIDILAYVQIAASSIFGKRPSDVELATAKTQIMSGIRRYWSRDSSQDPKRKITIGGIDYEVTTHALDDTSRGISYVVESGGFANDRSCNYGVILPGGWIAFSVPGGGEDDQQHTGAHEFGHSVLKDAKGFDYSLTHKGSSTRGQGPIEGHVLPKAGEVDLMQYYAGPTFVSVTGDKEVLWAHYSWDTYQRCNAVEEDVKALIACVRIWFLAS